MDWSTALIILLLAFYADGHSRSYAKPPTTTQKPAKPPVQKLARESGRSAADKLLDTIWDKVKGIGEEYVKGIGGQSDGQDYDHDQALNSATIRKPYQCYWWNASLTIIFTYVIHQYIYAAEWETPLSVRY